MDCIYDLLPEEDVEFLVIDADDAFWTLPNAPKERKYFLTLVGK